MQFGGLSNYWGLQIDMNILDDIKDLHRNIKTKIQRSFVDIFQKFRLLGEIKINRKIYKRDYKINLFDNIISNKKNSTFNITNPVLAYFKKKSNLEKNVNLELLNENRDKFTSQNYYNFFLKKKNIILHNYVVKKIYKKKIEFI